MNTDTEICPLCDVGTASLVHTFNVIGHQAGRGVADHALRECGLCRSEYAGSAEMAFNQAAGVKLRADMASYQATGKVPEGMLKCWSCRVLMYEDQRSRNDGHCPACECEIEI
jgi:hypothetical protein